MALDRLAIDRPASTARAHDDLVERLDGQVRERVRREGVDPQREALVVRRIAEDVVRDHDDLSLTGAVAPIADDGAMVGELVARISGFGPLQPFLDDPEVEEVWINSPERVFIARRGRHELTNLRLDAAQVNELVERMLKSSGRRLDISTPVRRRDAARGPPPPRRARGHHPRLHRGQHPQVPAPRAPALRPRRARHPDPAGGLVPRGLGARRAQHPRRRRHPGRQDDDAQLPGRLGARRRAGGQRRGGLRAALQPPRLGGDADPAGRARADRRDRAARPGQGGAADAARAASSSARCGPPSASTCCSRSTPACPGCAPSTPTAPARRS